MALTHMSLRDFVIVQELNLNLESGFTALTGETGAGKSILIDALQLVLGARADSGLTPPRVPGARRPRSASPWRSGWTPRVLRSRMGRIVHSCCCAARWTPRAKAAPGSTEAPPQPHSCEK